MDGTGGLADAGEHHINFLVTQLADEPGFKARDRKPGLGHRPGGLDAQVNITATRPIVGAGTKQQHTGARAKLFLGSLADDAGGFGG